ncbi:MAG: nucleotidyl transferase AbiEii/AbiGii toxin family protein [Acidimicrobiaceae bacterium]|nr:nucleotidyl transferase AbiEii/AbiGii toxin family protein [Acidimicrobiaceae bacterium]
MALTSQAIAGLHPQLSAQRLGDVARDAALDLYLMALAEHDAFARGGLVFKGGTAVRKFHCDPQRYRRISYDLDFALTAAPDRDKLTRIMSIRDRGRGLNSTLALGRHSRVRIDVPFIAEPLSVACDFAPSVPIQQPVMARLLPRPMHGHYGSDVTCAVPVMTPDETAAEKLARWQRRPTVRDLYDLTSLRPVIEDPAAVCEMYVIKSHQDFHNPTKGPSTASPAPVEFEGLFDGPDIGDLNPNELQFDVPTTRHDKQQLITDMLTALPERYGFCIELMNADMNRWAADTTGACTHQIQDAIAALRQASTTHHQHHNHNRDDRDHRDDDRDIHDHRDDDRDILDHRDDDLGIHPFDRDDIEHDDPYAIYPPDYHTSRWPRRDTRYGGGIGL